MSTIDSHHLTAEFEHSHATFRIQMTFDCIDKFKLEIEINLLELQLLNCKISQYVI